MTTGVMVPEAQNNYLSGQLKGLVGGVKGVFDLETLMEKGFPGMRNAGMGAAYYPTLHVCLLLLTPPRPAPEATGGASVARPVWEIQNHGLLRCRGTRSRTPR